MTPPEKNFSVKEFVNSDLFKKYTDASSSSDTSSNASSSKEACIEHPLNLNAKRKKDKDNSSHMYSSDFSSSSASSSMTSSSCSTHTFENKSKTSTKSSADSNNLVVEQSASSNLAVMRFYVRSLGWVKIDENDLTPERSSKAVNKCINDLSRGIKDLNDVVARWGQGKDLYLDLQDSYLMLTDLFLSIRY